VNGVLPLLLTQLSENTGREVVRNRIPQRMVTTW